MEITDGTTPHGDLLFGMLFAAVSEVTADKTWGKNNKKY